MIKKIISALLIFVQTAHAAYPPTTIQGQSDATATTKFNFQVPNNQYTDLGGIKSLIETGNNNLLKNPGFEASTYSTSWTITNSTGSLDTTNEVQGLQGAALSLSAQTGDLIRQSISPSSNLASQNFEASCRVKTSLTSIQVCGLVSNTEQTCVSVAPNDVSGLVTTNFISSSGATVGVKVKATSTETGSVYVDDCYVGQARNIGTTSQAILMGGLTITGCTGAWTTTSTTLTTFAVQTSCVYTTFGNALAPNNVTASNMIPGIKFAQLPAGDYMIQYEGRIQANGAGFQSYYQFYDGTNTARETSTFLTAAANMAASGINQSISYTAPQSNITLQIRGKVDLGGTAGMYGTTANPGVIKLWYFPNSSQQTYNATQLPASWSGYHGTDCSWNRGSTTYANYSEDNTCTFTERTNRNFGSVTSDIVATGRIPRILFTPNRAGMYQVCASFSAYSATTANATGYQMVDGSSNVLLQKINYTSLAGSPNILQMCVIVNATNTSTYTVNIQGQAAGVATNYINQTSNSTLDWTIVSLDNQFPAPILVNTVTSDSSGDEAIGRASVASTCAATPCTITSQSGNWVSSITRSATGRYTVNFTSGFFSGAPVCMSNPTVAPPGTITILQSVPTATSMTLGTRNSAGTDTDYPFSILCMGPK